MTEFRFANPAVFLLLVAAAGLFILRLRGQWNSLPAVMRYSDTSLLGGLSSGWRVRLRVVPDLLRVLAWLLLLVALARPQGGITRQIVRGEGVEIVIALDISRSMALSDFAPSRLEAAKNFARSFIARRSFDRIGLVVFAREAFHHVPLTLDHNVLLSLLDGVNIATRFGLDDGTAIGVGMASSANMLRSSDAPSRVIVLLTDGANNAGSIDPLTAALALQTLGIRVYTVGIGQPGFITAQSETGDILLVESDLDENTLQTIAEVTGGVYFLAADPDDLERIYQQIDRLERSAVEQFILVRWQDMAGGWIAAGLALLLLERLLRRTIFQTIP